MAHPSDQPSAAAQEAIRQVLFRDWDPVDVNYNENLRNEYDSYVPRVFRILAGSRSEEELIELLCRIEREEMGVARGAVGRLRPVAQKLLALGLK